jgi:hypothetical protein
MWRVEGPLIINEHGKVFDVQGGVDGEGKNIIVWNKHGKTNQQFDIVYVDEWKGEPGPGDMNERFGLVVDRTFYIVSGLDAGRYLDIIDTKRIVIKTRNGRNTQQWYFDQKSLTIKTRLNN